MPWIYQGVVPKMAPRVEGAGLPVEPVRQMNADDIERFHVAEFHKYAHEEGLDVDPISVEFNPVTSEVTYRLMDRSADV